METEGRFPSPRAADRDSNYTILMPGIVGIISQRPANTCQRLVKSMIASMEHERFYTSGTCFVPEMGVYSGWVALEGSFAAGQVFSNKQKDIALVFSGECF